jgi:hypothetical protein
MWLLFCVAHRATATIVLSAARATDSVAKVPAEVQATAGLVSAVTDFLALRFDLRIAFTAAVCRKPDKREPRRLQNPNPFDTRKRDRVKTR